MDLGHHFLFREGKPWPSHAYEVQRGEFDKILLDHAARQPNVTLLQPATVERVAFDADGVTAQVADAAGPRELRARFLVDASGRDSFLAARHGHRRPIPGLGKVALFAHFLGGRRWPDWRRAISASSSSRRAGSGTSRSPTGRPAWAPCSTRGRCAAATGTWSSSTIP